MDRAPGDATDAVFHIPPSFSFSWIELKGDVSDRVESDGMWPLDLIGLDLTR